MIATAEHLPSAMSEKNAPFQSIDKNICAHVSKRTSTFVPEQFGPCIPS